jgi:hypothetical protein
VALYEADRIDTQLEKASAFYLGRTAKYDTSRNRAYVPILCSWYRGDFGGESGMIVILKKYGIVPASRHPVVEYLPYDWTLQLSNYISF